MCFIIHINIKHAKGFPFKSRILYNLTKSQQNLPYKEPHIKFYFAIYTCSNMNAIKTIFGNTTNALSLSKPPNNLSIIIIHHLNTQIEFVLFCEKYAILQTYVYAMNPK